MTKDQCYLVGKATKTHGLKGEVTLWLDVDDPEEYTGLESVLVDINGELVPYFFEEVQIRGKKSIAKFEDIDTIEDVMYLINKDMYLPLDSLPKMSDQGFYYHEVVGYELINNSDKSPIGILKMVYEGAGQDLLAVDVEEKEVLIPIADEIIQKVDKEAKKMYLELPDGLLEIYLNS